MTRASLVVFLMLAGLATAALDDDLKVERKRTGRPGELTPQEEDKLDKIIDRFILFDIGALPPHERAQALADFKKLSAEAIPGLIRGLNKSANLSHSCPVVTIAKKLKLLLLASGDDRVLDFARDNIGAGVAKRSHKGILDDLKLTTILRQKQLRDIALAEKAKQFGSPATSPGNRGSGGGPPK